MAQYQIRVWQNDVSVQWLYTIEASNEKAAIKKYKAGNYTSTPEMIDIEAYEGNDDDTIEVEEV